jgi:uncharacterized protein YkwD
MPRALVLTVLVAGCAAVGPGQPAIRFEVPRAAYYNADGRVPLLGPFERDLLDRINRYLTARGFPALALDGALCRLGIEYTRQALRLGKRLPGPFVDHLLHHVGITEPHPLVLHASFPTEAAPAFALRLEKQLPRLLAWPATHIGLSALRVGGRVGVTVVVLSRAGRLEALPQRAPLGSVVPVRGQLAPGYDAPILLVTTPSGALRQESLPVRDRKFEGRVHLDDGRGTYMIEVLATGPLGPTVVSLFPLFCDTAPPDRFEEPPSVADTPEDAREAERRLVHLINEERRKRSLPPLDENPKLAALARAHSRDMVESGFVGHRSPRTGTLTDRLRSAGMLAEVSLENIARNDTLSGAHLGLMASPGHRRNILDPRVREVGVGVVFSGNEGTRQVYVTQNFVLPLVIVDSSRAVEDLWLRAQERRRSEGQPEFERNAVLDRVARLAAARVLAEGKVDASQGQAFIAGQLRTRGIRYHTLAAQFFIARRPEEPLQSRSWARPGRWRAGIGVAQEPRSAFGDYAICVVFLLAREATP